ncbi:MAG: hypothetical protein QM811_18390 [Pirellulales bacterium]
MSDWFRSPFRSHTAVGFGVSLVLHCVVFGAAWWFCIVLVKDRPSRFGMRQGRTTIEFGALRSQAELAPDVALKLTPPPTPVPQSNAHEFTATAAPREKAAAPPPLPNAHDGPAARHHDEHHGSREESHAKSEPNASTVVRPSVSVPPPTPVTYAEVGAAGTIGTRATATGPRRTRGQRTGRGRSVRRCKTSKHAAYVSRTIIARGDRRNRSPGTAHRRRRLCHSRGCAAFKRSTIVRRRCSQRRQALAR